MGNKGGRTIDSDMEKQYFDSPERIISVPSGKRQFDAALFGETVQRGFSKVRILNPRSMNRNPYVCSLAFQGRRAE